MLWVLVSDMITPTSNNLALTALAVPAAIVFSTHLLLTQKSLTVVLADPTNETPAHLQLRATELTMTLREIEGYRHGGIND